MVDVAAAVAIAVVSNPSLEAYGIVVDDHTKSEAVFGWLQFLLERRSLLWSMPLSTCHCIHTLTFTQICILGRHHWIRSNF